MLYKFGDLTFEFEKKEMTFYVYGIWKEKRLTLVSGDHGQCGVGSYSHLYEYVIDSFFDNIGTGSPLYYKYASQEAKKIDRTLAGIVMEIIKEEMPDGWLLRIEVDTWRAQGLTSQDLKTAAQQLLAKKDTSSEPSDEAQSYLQHRYDRLFPKEKIPLDKFLHNIASNGWYGAWLPQEYTEKQNIISTAACLAAADLSFTDLALTRQATSC